MPTSTLNLRLSITEVTDTETLRMHEARDGQSPPDDQHVWLFATLKHTYDDETSVFADAWVTWDCWLLIGVDGVKSSLRDEIKKSRRRQLRVSKERFPHARAATFTLTNR